MARKAGQLISRGSRTWLVRISLGRDPQSGTRKYHNMTVHGGLSEAQVYLNRKLQERDIGRLPRAAAIQLTHYLDQWPSVPIRWVETMPLERAVQEIGLFGNQNTVCKPTTLKWHFTVERLKERFRHFGT